MKNSRHTPSVFASGTESFTVKVTGDDLDYRNMKAEAVAKVTQMEGWETPKLVAIEYDYDVESLMFTAEYKFVRGMLEG